MDLAVLAGDGDTVDGTHYLKLSRVQLVSVGEEAAASIGPDTRRGSRL